MEKSCDDCGSVLEDDSVFRPCRNQKHWFCPLCFDEMEKKGGECPFCKVEKWVLGDREKKEKKGGEMNGN